MNGEQKREAKNTRRKEINLRSPSRLEHNHHKSDNNLSFFFGNSDFFSTSASLEVILPGLFLQIKY